MPIRFVRILLHITPATCALVALIAIGDLFVSILAGHHPPPSSLWSLDLVWLPAVWLLPAIVVSMLLTIGAFLLSWGASESAEASIERAARRFHGPDGNFKWTMGWVGFCGLGYLTTLYFVEAEFERLTEIPLAVAMLFAGVFSLSVTWAVHRIAVWRFPQVAANSVALSVAYLVITVVTIGGPIREVEPGLMSTGVVCIAFATGYVAALLRARLETRLWPAALVGVLVCFVIAIATMKSESASHAWASRHMYFHDAALAISQVPFDFDFDGHASLLGGADCDDTDPSIHPQAAEVVGNGVDDNCIGGDLESWSGPPVEFAVPQRMGGLTPVVFITVDTLRSDYVGRSIAGHSLTPNIDALASDAWRFERAYAPSTNTHESFPATMTGRYPADWRQSGVVFGLDQTIAEDLRALGYQTSAVLTMSSPTEALAWGFERVRARLGQVNNSKIAANSDATTLEAIHAFRELELDQPYFVWIHYFDPHGKYVSRDDVPEWLPDDGSQVSNYAREVFATDRAIGKLAEQMQAAGILDNAIVVFFSDHGEGLGDQGIEWHLRDGTEPIIRVPWFIRRPDGTPAETTGPTSLVRLRPTLHNLLGIQVPAAGTPLTPGQSDSPVFVASNPYKKPGLWITIDGPWKLVFDRARAAWALFNLDEDPAEVINLVEKEPEKFDELRELMGDWRDRTYNSEQLERKSKRYSTRQRYRPEYLEGVLHEASRL